MMLSLDDSQREAVFTRGNTVVTAGAGSGKTTVLARRFVYLIESGLAKADSILTLTFTRKAAAEMYERIYSLLLREEEAADSREKKERIRAAVAGFDEAQISTLDSFCARIVRGGSTRFGVSGDFRQDEYASARMNAETSLQFLLEHAGQGPLRRLVRDFGMEQVLEQFFIPLADEEFHLARSCDFPGMFDRQREYLRVQAAGITRRLEEVREWFLTENIPADKKSLWKVRTLLQSCGSPPELFEQNDWQGLRQAAELPVNSFGGKPKDPLLIEGRERIGSWKEAVKELVPIIALFLDEDVYRGLYSLLGEFQHRVMRTKKSSGVLTFRDVVEMAVLLLREDLDLRRYYKQHFTHIMIDEFQDNNDVQRQLLFLLAEKAELNTAGDPGPEELQPGKLFFVGDEKQSIYKFRGADVRVLKGLQKQMFRAGGTSLQLGCNYRSHSALIGFFNKLFSRIMPAGDEDSNDFEARFSPLAAPSAHTAFLPVIRLFYKAYDPDGELEIPDEEELLTSSEAEAWTVVQYIREMVEQKKLQVRDGSGPGGKEHVRPAVYDDVAILMRSSSNQIHFEKYLRRLKVPYTVQSIRSLFQEAPVNDIYQFLQLLVYPRDRTAYAALLRSPFAHLSDDTVFSILMDSETEEQEAFSHTGEEDFFPSEKDRDKYLRARQVYHKLLSMSARFSAAHLIRYLWYEAGYRYVVLRNPDYHLYLEFYDALISLARRSESRGENLAVFLDFVRENLGDYKKLEDLDLIPRESGGVQLLSIHKSKGLEFPVVFVADTGNSGAGDKGRLFVWDDQYGLVLNLPENGDQTKGKRKNYFTEMAREKMRQQDTAELKRLLYVACTRAQDHLVLSGYHHSKNRNTAKPEEQNVLLNMVLQALGWNGEDSPLDLSSPLGCEIAPIPDFSSESVNRQSSFSRGQDPERVYRNMLDSAVIIRDFPKRDWTPTELNGLYRKYSGPGADRQGCAGQEGLTGRERAGRDIYAGRQIGRGVPSADPASKGDLAGKELRPGGGLTGLDDLLSEYEVSAAFGELVHSCIEYELSRKPGTPPLPQALLTMDPAETARLEDAARTMAASFFASDLGKEAKSAVETGLAESELPFVLRLGPDETGADIDPVDGPRPVTGERHGAGLMVRGQIDLLLIREDQVAVIDFKTDHIIHPEEYAAQMEAYRQAAAELYSLPAVSFLVYVRYGRVCELDIPVDLEGLIAAGESGPSG